MSQGQTPPGWYHAEGDPADTSRYWDGSEWIGDPVHTGPTPPAASPLGGQPPGHDTPWAGSDNVPPADFGGVAGVGGVGGFSPVGATPGQPELIGAGGRIGGRVIDAIIWLVISVVSAIPLIAVSIDDFIDAFNSGSTTSPDINVGLVFATAVVNLALIVAYEVFLNLSGGTLGKRAVSAEIVKDDGSPLDLNAAVMRMVPYIVVQGLGVLAGLLGSNALDNVQQLVFFLVALAGLVMLFADGRRQTPWDKVGRTIVVRS